MIILTHSFRENQQTLMFVLTLSNLFFKTKDYIDRLNRAKVGHSNEKFFYREIKKVEIFVL